MGKILSDEEIEVLECLKGKLVFTSGYCSVEDDQGIARDQALPSYSGVLREVNYDPNTKELKSLKLEAEGFKNVDFNLQNGARVWNFHRGLYYDGNEVLVVSSR